MHLLHARFNVGYIK